MMSDWEGAERLMETWHRRVVEAQAANHESAIYFQWLHYALGGPAVVISAIVSAAVFKEIGVPSNKDAHIIIGGLSAIAAVLTSLQTLLDYNKRAERHHSAAAKYGMIRRKLEEQAALSIEDRGKPERFLDEVRRDIDALSLDAPEIPKRIWDKTAKKMKDDPPTPLFHGLHGGQLSPPVSPTKLNS